MLRVGKVDAAINTEVLAARPQTLAIVCASQAHSEARPEVAQEILKRSEAGITQLAGHARGLSL